LVKIIVSPIPVPSHHEPDVPPAFDRWWAKAASRDPDQRFQSAKEFAEALQVACGTSQMTELMDRASVGDAAAAGAAGEPAQARPPMASFEEQDEASLVELVSATPAGMGRTFNGSEVHSRPAKRSARSLLAALLLASCLGTGAVVVAMKSRVEAKAPGAAPPESTVPTPHAEPGESAPAPVSSAEVASTPPTLPSASASSLPPKAGVSNQRGVAPAQRFAKPPVNPKSVATAAKAPEPAVSVVATQPAEPVPPPVIPPAQPAAPKPPTPPAPNPCSTDPFCGHTRFRP
jgi:serine/threonine-protein kinase